MAEPREKLWETAMKWEWKWLATMPYNECVESPKNSFREQTDVPLLWYRHCGEPREGPKHTVDNWYGMSRWSLPRFFSFALHHYVDPLLYVETITVSLISRSLDLTFFYTYTYVYLEVLWRTSNLPKSWYTRKNWKSVVICSLFFPLLFHCVQICVHLSTFC